MPLARIVVAVVATLTVWAGSARGQAPLPAFPYYAVTPADPSPPQTPLQQQVLENYRTQLRQTQREMVQQNPAGLGRTQLEIGRQLNTLGNAYLYPSATPIVPNPAPRMHGATPGFPYSVGPSRRALKLRNSAVRHERQATPPAPGGRRHRRPAGACAWRGDVPPVAIEDRGAPPARCR